ncbi:MAG: response regulator transcription factor [Saprospiraceae bacterium]|nr:response regulator transcription factor [Pyrinomonadaceae bacterium]
MPKPNPSKEHIRVVVADDNKQVREKVVQLLQPRFELVGAAADGGAAFEMVMLLEPEIVILDISMPVMSGIEAAAKMKSKGSKTKTVFLTVHDDPDFVREALNLGASGYVVKSQMATDLSAAIRAAIEGYFFISPSCALSEDLTDN